MKKQRKHYTPEEKVDHPEAASVGAGFRSQNYVTNTASSRPSFYRWPKELFENGTAAFQSKARPNRSAEQQRIDYFEKKIQTKDEALAELMAEHVALKKNAWGTLTGVCVPHDTRDQIVDFVRRWSEKTGIGAGPRREGSEVGAGAKTASDSSAAVCVKADAFGATLRETHFPPVGGSLVYASARAISS